MTPRSVNIVLSAEFELRGDPDDGELILYTPLGSTAASLSWSPGMAQLRTNEQERQFASLDALMAFAVGTELPVAVLFAWLAGEPRSTAGWSADLSQFASGRITAQRNEPGPIAQLKLLLER